MPTAFARRHHQYLALHSIGEFKRLNARELLRTLWTDEDDHATGIALMRDLSLSLDKHRYGSSAAQYNVDRESIEVDAFMHPIVAAYRFDEAYRSILCSKRHLSCRVIGS